MRRNRSEKHGILYDGPDPSSLLSCGLDLPQHITDQLIGVTERPDLLEDETAPPTMCCLCGDPGATYRMATQYRDDEQNYVTACERCQPYVDRDVQAQFEDLH